MVDVYPILHPTRDNDLTGGNYSSHLTSLTYKINKLNLEKTSFQTEWSLKLTASVSDLHKSLHS